MRINRPYVNLDPAAIEKARQIDLLSYLQCYEPENLKRIASNIYCTNEHDSLKISNGKWYWWSRGIGGISALDYLIKVKDYNFVDAVEALAGRHGQHESAAPLLHRKTSRKYCFCRPKIRAGSRL